MRSRLISTAIILAGLMAAGPAFGQQSQSLRWQFQAGQRLHYEVQQNMKMSMDYNGKPLTTEMKQTINTVWHVMSLDRNGNATLTQKIDRIRLTILGGTLEKVQFDTASKEPVRPELKTMASVFSELMKSKITTVMSPTGQVVSINVPPRLIETLKNAPGVGQAGFDEDSLRQMFNQSGVVMPVHPVAVGQKWTSKNEVRTPAGKMKFSSLLNYRGTQDYQGGNYARIDMKPTVRMEQDPKSPVKVSLKSSGGSGAVLFDYRNGRIMRTKLQSKMIMNLDQNGEAIQQTIDQTVSMRYIPTTVAAKAGTPTPVRR